MAAGDSWAWPSVAAVSSWISQNAVGSPCGPWMVASREVASVSQSVGRTTPLTDEPSGSVIGCPIPSSLKSCNSGMFPVTFASRMFGVVAPATSLIVSDVGPAHGPGAELLHRTIEFRFIQPTRKSCTKTTGPEVPSRTVNLITAIPAFCEMKLIPQQYAPSNPRTEKIALLKPGAAVTTCGVAKCGSPLQSTSVKPASRALGM